MVAALSPDHRYLILSVVNATESEQNFDLSVAGTHLASPSTQWQLTANTVDAVNRPNQLAQMTVKEMPIADASKSIAVAPISINIYRFPVTGAE